MAEYSDVWTDRQGNYHFKIDLSSYKGLNFTTTDYNGDLVNLTGRVSTLNIRKSRFEDVLITKTCTNLNQTTYTGQTVAILTSTDISLLSLGRYEYEYILLIGELQPIVKRGTLTIV